MELQQMRYFLAVAETGNITAAAKLLHIAQPPLSRQMKQIENDLQVQLFDRSGRRLRLTEAGRVLMLRVQEILNLTDRSLKEVRSSELGVEGILSLGTVASASFVLLPHMIADFKEQYPKTQFQLFIGETSRIIELLEKGIIEVGVVRHPFEDRYLESCCLPKERLLVAYSVEKFPDWQGKTVLTVKEIATAPLLIHRKYEMMLKRIMRRYGCKGDFLCLCDDIIPVIAWAGAGLGLAVIPESASEMARKQHLQCSIIDDEEMMTTSALIWTRKHYHSGIAANFIKFFTEAIHKK